MNVVPISFCFVVPKADLQAGPEASGLAFCVQDAAQSGHKAHLLFAEHGRGKALWEGWCSERGITFEYLEKARMADVPAYGHPHELVSLHVYHVLRQQSYNAICFAFEGACGFHCVQAKRVLGHFSQSVLIVLPARRAHTAGEQREQPLAATRRLFGESYCARYADARDWRAGLLSAVTAHKCLPDEAARKSSPLLSVCMAHYNHGAYLPQALASLAAQDYPNFEVIVMDDGSSDAASRAVFARCRAEADPRFRFYEQPNAGPGPARNACAALAGGDWLVFMDADNIAMPHMLHTFAHAALRTGLDALTCHFTTFASDFEGNGMPTGQYTCIFTGQDTLTSLLENVFGDTNMIIRAGTYQTLGGMRDEPSEDWIFLARLSLAGYTMDVIPDPLYFYRLNPEGRNLCTDPVKASLAVCGAYKDILGKFGLQVTQQLLLPLYWEMAEKSKKDEQTFQVNRDSVILNAAIRAGLFFEARYQFCFPQGSRRQRVASWLRHLFSSRTL